MILIKSPKTEKEYNAYFKFRWETLRKPLGQPEGSEKDELELMSQHVMLVNEDNCIMGVGRIHFVFNKSNKKAQIRYMAIDEKIQKQGYGTKILLELENIAINNKASNIFLHARIEALNFYEKNNYKKVNKSHLLFNKIQHWLMEKKV